MAALTVALSDNIAGGLCYMLGPFTAGYFLVTEPYSRNPKVRFHALQSMYLSLATLVAIFVLPFVGTILQLLSSELGNFFTALSFSLYMLPFVVWMAVTFRAFSGRRLALPIIGRLAQRQAG